jgi:misacylated tRNA(Ala) deacylase
VGDDGIRLSQTVFYAHGGGQPGDVGIMKWANGVEVEIINTLKGDNIDDIVHVPASGASLPSVGDVVNVEVNWQKRFLHMRFHTAMHVLCSLVEGEVTGGNLNADKARLDFNLPDGPPDKDDINNKLAEVIASDAQVTTRWIDDAELDANPDLVRTMSVQPPRGSGKIRLVDVEGVDLQPCGGTHVSSLSQIGSVYVAKIENKGKQNRRFIMRFHD